MTEIDELKHKNHIWKLKYDSVRIQAKHMREALREIGELWHDPDYASLSVIANNALGKANRTEKDAMATEKRVRREYKKKQESKTNAQQEKAGKTIEVTISDTVHPASGSS